MRFRWAIVGVMLVGVTACQSLLDVDHITFSDEDGPGKSGAGGGEGGQGGDGGASVSVSQTSTSTGIPTENCLNGVDDDDDGDVDCADSDCVDYACIDATGEEWQQLSGLDAGASCRDGLQGGLAIDEGSFSCSPCECATTTTCRPQPTEVHAAAACQFLEFTTQPQQLDACNSVSNIQEQESIRPFIDEPPSADCNASGSEPQGEAATLVELRTLCPATFGGGCGAEMVCAPRAQWNDGVPQEVLCVESTGPSCTEGLVPVTLLDELVDNRDCESCACALVDDGACSYTSTFYANGGCTAELYTVTHDGACHPVSGLEVTRRQTGTVITPAQCNITSGGVVGSVSATQRQLCCVPPR